MDIIKLAREAGFDVEPYLLVDRKMARLERFTDLVLEEAAKVCDSLHHWTADCCAKDIRQMKHHVVNIDK